MLRVYRAESFGIARVFEGNRERLLEPRLDLRSFSPNGFAWEYFRGGPQQLALAIIADLYDDEVAVACVMEFTAQAVAKRSKDLPFEMTEAEVRAVVQHIQESAKCSE